MLADRPCSADVWIAAESSTNLPLAQAKEEFRSLRQRGARAEQRQRTKSQGSGRGPTDHLPPLGRMGAVTRHSWGEAFEGVSRQACADQVRRIWPPFRTTGRFTGFGREGWQELLMVSNACWALGPAGCLIPQDDHILEPLKA